MGSIHLALARYVDGTTVTGESLPVRILVHGARQPRPGVAWSRASLRPDEIVMRMGIPCANVHRSLLDEICEARDLRDAVVLIDMVLFAELTSLARFSAYVASVGPRRGIRMARRALALAMEGSESPRETLMRLVWVLDAGLPAPLCNVDVWDRGGRFVARPDLLSVEFGVVGEYDGENHQETRRRRNDLRRETSLRNLGLEYFSFVAGELHDRAAAARRMQTAVARAQRSATEQRWTTERPRGRVETVDERVAARERRVLVMDGRAALERRLSDTPHDSNRPDPIE